MITAMGIPPHIGLASQLRDMLGMLTNLVAAFQQQSDNLIVSVEKALENKAWESGHVTGAKLKEILKEFHGSVNKNLEGIRTMVF